MAKPLNVISHWYKLIENFEASAQEFYGAFEVAVSSRAVPQAHADRVEFKEHGLASANREYLRIQRGQYAFDICAAPFGKGFFVSWWLTEPPLRFGLLYTLAFLFALGFAMNLAFGIGYGLGAVSAGASSGLFMGMFFAFIGVPFLLFLLGNALRQGVLQGESAVLGMPLVGALYQRIFAPTTFYSLDTALMFQESVHNSVLEVVDAMAAAKGVRALSEAERRPVLKRLAQSV